METLLNLGINWQSIIFYLINFGILLAFVGYYAFPKLYGYLEERQKIIKGNLDEANELKESFQKKMEELRKEKEATHKKLISEIEEMRANLEKKRSEMVAEMEGQRTKLLDEAQAEIEVKKSEILKDAEQQTLKLIEKIVLYVVQNKVPEEVVKQSVGEAWEQYNNR